MGPPSYRRHFSLLFLSLTSLIAPGSSSSDLTAFVFKGCANQNFQDPTGIYSQALKTLFASLTSQSSSANFYRATSGQDQSAITGLFQCRGDLSSSDCSECVSTLPAQIQSLCGVAAIAARVQLTGCYMRYEVVGFREEGGTQLLYKRCGSTRASGDGFEERLNAALGMVERGVGASGNGFYAGGYESVYALGQCEGDLGSGDCVDCVRSAEESSRSECGTSISGHIYLQRCYISYTYYPNGVPGNSASGIGTGTGEERKGNGKQKTVAIVFGGVVGGGLFVTCVLVLKSAFLKKRSKHGGGYY